MHISKGELGVVIEGLFSPVGKRWRQQMRWKNLIMKVKGHIKAMLWDYIGLKIYHFFFGSHFSLAV